LEIGLKNSKQVNGLGCDAYPSKLGLEQLMR
jgi:hypothetical protein